VEESRKGSCPGRDVSLPAVSRGGERLAYAQQHENVNVWRAVERLSSVVA
jgi:hypothetical protein